jgi:SNF2 family DNA or RNA helicase
VYKAILLPVNVKANCGEHECIDLTSSNFDENICENSFSDLNEESSAKKTRKKSSGKVLYDLPEISRKTLRSYEIKSTEAEKERFNFWDSYSDPNNIRRLIETRRFANFDDFKLNLEALNFKQSGKIDSLISAEALRAKIIPYNFQMQVALRAINEMNANAILSDEVGLGKTIEAGLILKELLLREEIHSVIIVCPKSLLPQWKTEMAEKFSEDFTIANNHKINFKSVSRVICSHNLLARKYDEVASRTWDLVVVDEAHAFRNMHSKGRGCLSNLGKNHLLLLTATPLCNRLTDLYSIVDLIQPGIFGSERSFVARFAQDAKSRIVKPAEAEPLRQMLREVMCRNRREETGVPFTRRCVDSRSLEADRSEREFIDKATDYLRDIGNNSFKTIETLIAENPTRQLSASQSQTILVFQAIALQQSFSSSPEASIESLKKRQQRFPSELAATNQLIEMAKQISSSKIKLFKQILGEIPNEQALIFCLRKTTTYTIKEILDSEFGKSAVYTGDMSQAEREKVVEAFRRGDVKYLVATDAAAEGLNLQNCCVMFNYDLHWNPMKLEQRIGRIHRYKQDRDVTVFNLSIKDTIDDYVLHILYQKIDLFNMTIGKMETVLAELKEGSQDIQKTIMQILLRSNSHLDIKKELDNLANDLHVSRKNQELSESFTQGVLG